MLIIILVIKVITIPMEITIITITDLEGLVTLMVTAQFVIKNEMQE